MLKQDVKAVLILLQETKILIEILQEGQIRICMKTGTPAIQVSNVADNHRPLRVEICHEKRQLHGIVHQTVDPSTPVVIAHRLLHDPQEVEGLIIAVDLPEVVVVAAIDHPEAAEVEVELRHGDN